MNKDIKDFGKYLSLLVAIYFTDETLKYYLPLNFSWSGYAWIGAIICALIFYLLSK